MRPTTGQIGSIRSMCAGPVLCRRAGLLALTWEQCRAAAAAAETAYKQQSRHVLVVGGDHGMGGAVAVAAEAPRVGAGLERATAEHVGAILTRHPKSLARGVEPPT